MSLALLEKPLVATRPVLSHTQVLWLRDILRDAGCGRLERECIERYVDGEPALSAAAALGRPIGECRALLQRARGRAQPYYDDVGEIMLAAAGALLWCVRDARTRGGSVGGQREPSSEQAELMEAWLVYTFESEWA